MLFLHKSEVIWLHSQLVGLFGGSHGLRDEGALEAALLAAENRAFYEDADLITCAAVYAYHLTQAHAFIDGNKRVAAAATELFLELNGELLEASDEALVALFMGIAAGRLTRGDVEAHLRVWTRPKQ